MNHSAFRPATLDEALQIRAEHRVRPVAGGTDLMVACRRHAPVPVRLDAPPLFIAHLPELSYVRREPHRIRLGAATTLRELAASADIAPGLREAIRWFASPAIRNAATVGGNICNASPAADLVPYLVARDATVEVHGRHGSRELAVRDFITGPAQHVLSDSELLTEVRIPAASDAPPFWYYRKVAARRSNALSKLSLYLEARFAEDGTIAELRIAAGAVAPTVIRCEEAERLLTGLPVILPPAAIDDAVGCCARAVSPIDDQRSTAAYRMSTMSRLIRRVLEHDLPAWSTYAGSDD